MLLMMLSIKAVKVLLSLKIKDEDYMMLKASNDLYMCYLVDVDDVLYLSPTIVFVDFVVEYPSH